MRTCSLLALTACVALVTAHYSPPLAAQSDHQGFRALPKIQSHPDRDASTHRGKGRRRWHSDHHHHAKHVKAVAAHYSLFLAAQRNHRGFRALAKIQSHAGRDASTHRGKGRRRWHSDHHHHAKHVKAVAAHCSLLLAAQRNHRGSRALANIQSHAVPRCQHASGHGTTPLAQRPSPPCKACQSRGSALLTVASRKGPTPLAQRLSPPCKACQSGVENALWRTASQ